jgi:ComF family protein
VQRYAGLKPRCQTCAIELPKGQTLCGTCMRARSNLDFAVAALDYGFPWNKLLQQFKFSNRIDLAEALLDRLDSALDLARPPAPDILLPVPLARQRLSERGYNQSWELVRRLALRRGLRCEDSLVLRVRDTPHQTDLPASRRSANMRGAFAVEPLRRRELQGRRIAIIDDVMTTGATLQELARVLKKAGVVQVQAWVLARTPID